MAEVAASTDLETLWAEMNRVADEIGQEWPQGVSALVALDRAGTSIPADLRRDLLEAAAGGVDGAAAISRAFALLS